MYPTPVWGRTDVPGYDAGPFVRSGYKWTARTTELHPDGECMHRPPRGETPGGRDQSQRRAPRPPRTLPGNKPANNPVGPRGTPSEHNRGHWNTEGKRGEHEGCAAVSCEVSCNNTPGAGGMGHRVHPFSRVLSSHSLR